MVKETKETPDKILVVDDNADALYALEKILAHQGYNVIAVSSGEAALEQARAERPSLVLLDVMMPHMDGLEVTRRFKADPVLRFIPVLLLTAKDSLADVVQGLDNGADGYLSKPFKPEELLARTRAGLRIRGLYEELRTTEERNTALLKEISGKYDIANIIGESESIRRVLSLTEKVARSESTVLITGASGTGKELVARAIHFGSRRKTKPFIAKNCAAFSEHLLESQLFGHTKGAFTGAVKDQIGLFEAADGGTLFLDEVGEMAPVLQAKLLRVLQEGTFMPVGSTDESSADVRVLAATHRDLRAMCDSGAFREDLYYRLAVITIPLPTLGERREDIPLLIQHFLERHALRRGAQAKTITKSAIQLLAGHPWRGNIRELENELERMLILGDEDEVLDVDLLSPEIAAQQQAQEEQKTGKSEDGSDLKRAVENLEREMILQALEKTGWNKTNSAKLLGISRSNLIAKVQEYNLTQKPSA